MRSQILHSGQCIVSAFFVLPSLPLMCLVKTYCVLTVSLSFTSSVTPHLAQPPPQHGCCFELPLFFLVFISLTFSVSYILHFLGPAFQWNVFFFFLGYMPVALGCCVYGGYLCFTLPLFRFLLYLVSVGGFLLSPYKLQPLGPWEEGTVVCWLHCGQWGGVLLHWGPPHVSVWLPGELCPPPAAGTRYPALCRFSRTTLPLGSCSPSAPPRTQQLE